ncbi:Phosphate acetyltransferase [Aedoeadaptatus ivorii]|uniref:Phosphate acetyltransferase n=1 Tax=Aedoeadaptatus ivorii TaxID=54006 RepID=A0A3S5C254_9FIRM|nr:phosphate acetyltransferase [Peptoniphilus ivorii]MDQ0507968.1 phosphate acetyltransferase [Peptoniphilus ivorii]VEJ34797.1 Phosphate acetyltransferase [Peptoniphilus ivorii]
MDFMQDLRDRLKCRDIRVVFPEGQDPRILWAAAEHQKEGLIHPIVLGFKNEIEATAEREGIDISGLEIVEIGQYEHIDELVEKFVERRKGKIDETRARAQLHDPNYLGTMMVYAGYADGMVSGAVHTTGQTILPALQIIKTKKGVSRVSGLFILLRGDERYLMADCAINTEMDAPTLAEVAVSTHETAKQFGFDPKLAMLSFSTKGSAKGDSVKKVEVATYLVNESHPEINVDGELQFDAAIDPEVAKKKAPGSEVAGQANAFIFPNLECGNIGYKIAQRLGGFTAIGPILQGLNMPVNDLSRGCNKEETYQLALITAVQACLGKE